MAKKKNGNADPSIDMSLPEGFDPVTPLGGERFWVIRREGVLVQGVLLGRFARRGANAKGHYYQVGITGADVDAVKGAGENTEQVLIGRGGIVCIDETKALEDLQAVAESDNRTEVVIRFGAKVTLAGGQSFWPAAIGSRVLPDRGTPAAETDYDDIPF